MTDTSIKGKILKITRENIGSGSASYSLRKMKNALLAPHVSDASEAKRLKICILLILPVQRKITQVVTDCGPASQNDS